MSVKKFKVGDKVRVRKELGVGRLYGEQILFSDMGSMIGRIVTIKEVRSCGYRLEESGWNWTDEMLEPVEKTLENLEKGDLIDCKDGNTKKVLAALDGCYLLSFDHNHQKAEYWYTVHELEDKGWKPIQQKEAAPKPLRSAARNTTSKSSKKP